MLKYLSIISLIFSLLFLSCKQGKDSQKNILDVVDPLIGTAFHGHTFPGPVLAHGRIQPGPDTHIIGWDASSGYHYDDSLLYGFSQTHLSGTGIGDMGDILLLPFLGDVGESKPLATLDHSTETAEAGYYSIEVNPWEIKTEITATSHTAIYRFMYPSSSTPRMMVDLEHVLQPNWGHKLISSEIRKVDEYSLEGFRFTSGWAKDDPIWFRLSFNQPIQKSDLMVDGNLQENSELARATAITAYLSFAPSDKPLEARISVSSVDKLGARQNLEKTTQLSFDQHKEAAQNLWKSELEKIQIKTTDVAIKKNFYTALYHSKIAPMNFTDLDGRFRGIDQKIYKKGTEDSYTVYSLWDVFRSWYPLMTLIEPERSRTWAYDLYDHSEKGGLLPKWALNGNYTGTMVGYPALAILADAYAKDMLDSIPEQLLEASVKASSWQADFNKKHKGTRAERVMPKQIYYKEAYGFIPADSSNASVSYGLEMAYYDWCVAEMAKGMGKQELEEKYREKAAAYQRYFDSEVGFMRGINKDGSRVKEFNPRLSDHEHSDYIEGNAWQWTPLVLHDPEGFRDLLGGKEALGVWLDSLFTTSSEIAGENVSADISGLIGQYAHGNEPSHHVPFLYQYSDRPWRTQEVLDQILYEFYTPSPDGIIGNEDCGQMSAWYVLNALGLYQLTPGKAEFSIGRPIVEEASIWQGKGYFHIKVHNNSRQHKYVEKVLLNGKELEEWRILYSDFQPDALIEIFMGGERNE
ncbi:MAG: GH92 family glycosyl hydrolase [Bacteroidota bacterium]